MQVQTQGGSASTGPAQEIDATEVWFIPDMVRALRTSRATIERRLRDGSFPYPELPPIDNRHRWSRCLVEHMIRTRQEPPLARRRPFQHKKAR
jgi:hypothetical protein